MKNRQAFHKLALLFPEMASKHLADLTADIKEKGLLNPIVRHEGEIVDGRARIEACKRAHVHPRFVEFSSLGLKCGVEDFVWSTNIERRHLTADQRAVIASKWRNALRTEGKERQLQALKTKRQAVEGIPSQPNATRRAVAQRGRVSSHKIQQVEKVTKFAPGLLPKVESGKMKLKDAAKQADRKRPKSKLLNMPIRNRLTPDQAVRQTMNSLSAYVKKILHRVENKAAFFELLGVELGRWVRRTAKAA